MTVIGVDIDPITTLRKVEQCVRVCTVALETVEVDATTDDRRAGVLMDCRLALDNVAGWLAEEVAY